MIWPLWIALAVVAVAVSDDRRPALAILGGLLAMRLAPVIPEPWRLVASAGLWVGIGGFIVAQFAAAVCGALVVACGLCYIWARVGGYPVAFGSAPFVASDVLGVLALLVAACGERDGGIRTWFLGRRPDRRSNRASVRVAAFGKEGAR